MFHNHTQRLWPTLKSETNERKSRQNHESSERSKRVRIFRDFSSSDFWNVWNSIFKMTQKFWSTKRIVFMRVFCGISLIYTCCFCGDLKQITWKTSDKTSVDATLLSIDPPDDHLFSELPQRKEFQLRYWHFASCLKKAVRLVLNLNWHFDFLLSDYDILLLPPALGKITIFQIQFTSCCYISLPQ